MNTTLKQILKKHKRLLRPKQYAQKFTGKKFLGLFRPGVYIILKKEQVLYVGKCGYQVIKRAVVSNPHALDNATALQLLPCKNPKDADTLELVLIRELQPKFNKQRK
jgi:hypothetical protein